MMLINKMITSYYQWLDIGSKEYAKFDSNLDSRVYRNKYAIIKVQTLRHSIRTSVII